MNEQEAIEILKELNDNYFQPDRKGEFDCVNNAIDEAIEALEEIQQHRALGTVEELREAMEKQAPKKPNIQQWMDTKCCCGYTFSKHHGDGYYSIPQEKKTKYCPNCGQRLKWSDEE